MRFLFYYEFCHIRLFVGYSNENFRLQDGDGDAELKRAAASFLAAARQRTAAASQSGADSPVTVPAVNNNTNMYETGSPRLTNNMDSPVMATLDDRGGIRQSSPLLSEPSPVVGQSRRLHQHGRGQSSIFSLSEIMLAASTVEQPAGTVGSDGVPSSSHQLLTPPLPPTNIAAPPGSSAANLAATTNAPAVSLTTMHALTAAHSSRKLAASLRRRSSAALSSASDRVLGSMGSSSGFLGAQDSSTDLMTTTDSGSRDGRGPARMSASDLLRLGGGHDGAIDEDEDQQSPDDRAKRPRFHVSRALVLLYARY